MNAKAIGYLRVSTERQANEGVSLDVQRHRIKAHCEAHGLRFVRCYEDAGISGRRTENRPALEKAINHVCLEGGVLIVYSLSRLARSTRDAIRISERLAKSEAQLVSLSEQIDTTSAAGKMFFRIMSVLSEFESDLIGERTRTALAHKRENGMRYCNHAPFGYRHEGDLLVQCDEEQRVLRLMRRWWIKGDTFAEIARRLNERRIAPRGTKTFSRQRVRKILVRDT